MNAKDNGEPASLQSRFDQVEKHVSVIHGAIEQVKELDTYSLSYSQASFAHCIGVKGVASEDRFRLLSSPNSRYMFHVSTRSLSDML